MTKYPLGPSFPFIEEKEEKLFLGYNALKVSKHGNKITLLFMQGDTAIYAYTYKAENDYDVAFENIKGSVMIELKNKQDS